MNYIKYIKSRDGTKLYTKVMDVKEPKANIIFVHGLAEHLERYDKIANFFHENNFNVIRYDQRGHARSEGKQTFYNHYEEIIEDLDAIVNFTKSNYEGKVYVVGHSMGGYTVALYGSKHPNNVDGYITSGALTRMHLDLFGEIDDDIPAETYVNNELSDGVCSDPEVIKKYTYDDLVSKQISIGLIRTLITGIDYLKNNPNSFVDPILIMHGKLDGLVSVEDSFSFYKEIASENKSLRIYENLEHEILNESSYNEVIFVDMLNWIMNELERDPEV